MSENGVVQKRERIDLQFLLHFSGTLSIQSGFPRGTVDRTVMRGLDGMPYIPASTLKGRVRDMAERVAPTLGYTNICRAPNPKFMCPERFGIDGEHCIVCRTFGAPGVSSRSGGTGLIWRDARLIASISQPLRELSESQRSEFYYSRTQAQLSRARGVSLGKHLFTSENTMEGLHFRGRVRGWMQPTKALDGGIPEGVVLLCSALKLLSFVGSGKSRGLGQCEVEFDQTIKIGERDIEMKQVLQLIDQLG